MGKRTEVVTVSIPVEVEYDGERAGARENVIALLSDTSYGGTLFNTRRVTGASIDHGGYELRMQPHSVEE